jgi:hypothetical protein
MRSADGCFVQLKHIAAIRFAMTKIVFRRYTSILLCVLQTKRGCHASKQSCVFVENLLRQILGDNIKLYLCNSHLCISHGHHVGITDEINRYRIFFFYLRLWKMSKISFETRGMLFVITLLQLHQLTKKLVRVIQKYTDAITLIFP